MINKKKILVTGAAGFIGFHLVKKMTSMGFQVVGIDNLNPNYDKKIKNDRIKFLNKMTQKKLFTFIKCNIDKKNELIKLNKYKFVYVIHLAAQPGVRYSLLKPEIVFDSNIRGFFNILEIAKKNNVKHFMYASSSSVYGGNSKLPFSEIDNVDSPLNLYAASKKCNELLAFAFSHINKIRSTGLRFFSVYGPWGRPDMAYYLFSKRILQNKKIDVFNNGNHKRDFTYIDEVIQSIVKILKSNKFNKKKLHNVINIGRNKKIKLMQLIKYLELYLEKKANINFIKRQKADMLETYADIRLLKKIDPRFKSTEFKEGIKKFILWFKEYHKNHFNF